MIAIPLNESKSTVISELYGKAPYFALLNLETGSFKVIKNDGCGDGKKTAEFIINTEAKKTIFYHMGKKLFDFLEEGNISVYSSSKTFSTIEDIYKEFLNGSVKLINNSNSSALLDAGNCDCTCKN